MADRRLRRNSCKAFTFMIDPGLHFVKKIGEDLFKLGVSQRADRTGELDDVGR